MTRASISRTAGAPAPPSPDELTAAIEVVLRSLPPDKREEIKHALLEDPQPIPASKAPRGGPVLRVITTSLPQQQQWTAKDVLDVVRDKGVTASPKQVYNALGYLRRKGHIKRISYGRYMVEDVGAGLVTSDDLGVEPRIEDD